MMATKKTTWKMNSYGIETIVEFCTDDLGREYWYWCVKVDGGIYADGEAPDRMIAQSRCAGHYEEARSRQEGTYEYKE